ncbi:hypothetical protein P8452_15726 [Trifolium repens]|nr:hypothetical protein P8452_15726 [Trifolium repens]
MFKPIFPSLFFIFLLLRLSSSSFFFFVFFLHLSSSSFYCTSSATGTLIFSTETMEPAEVVVPDPHEVPGHNAAVCQICIQGQLQRNQPRPPIGLIIIPPSMPKLVPYDYTRPGVSFAAAASSSQPTSAPPQPMIRRNRRA